MGRRFICGWRKTTSSPSDLTPPRLPLQQLIAWVPFKKRICDRFSPSHRFRTNLNVLLSLHNKMLSLQEGATKTASRLSLCTERGMWNYFYANYVMALEHTFLYFFFVYFRVCFPRFFILRLQFASQAMLKRAENRAYICWTGTFLLCRTLQSRGKKIYLHFLWRILQAPVIFLLHAIAMQRPRRQRRMQCKYKIL